jgi:hypothetical protein
MARVENTKLQIAYFYVMGIEKNKDSIYSLKVFLKRSVFSIFV